MRYESLATKHVAIGIAPVANAFASTVSSDIVNMTCHQSATFYVFKGVGTTGTSTITVEACDDVSASNVTAVPFYYRKITTNDVNQAPTAAAAAGFTTTAGSAQVYIIEVDQADLAATGYKYVRLTCVEVVAAAVLGGILIVLNNPKYGDSATHSVIV